LTISPPRVSCQRMIIYLCTKRNSEAMASWLRTWGRSMANHIAVMPYDGLTEYRSLPPAAYLFADLELITDAQRRLAASLWNQLSATGRRARLLNHPTRSLMRYDLLKTLHRRELLAYNVYRATELPAQLKYPVFVRVANDHSGSRTPLLHNRQHVESAIVNSLLLGHEPEQILVVEFYDASDQAGVYHKYGAFRIGQRIVPRHLIFSRNWVIKRADEIVSAAYLALERKWMETNPHESQLKEIFDLAQIEYGRIDYCVRDGKVQCWEINTAPTIMMSPESCRPEQLPNQQLFVRLIISAFLAIDVPTQTEAQQQIPYSLDLQTAIGVVNA